MCERFAERLSRRTVDEEKWTSRCFRKLASLYGRSPCLWKKDATGYLDSERRHRAYARIHRAMGLPGVTFVEIVLKIREMRRFYVDELKRVLENASRGRRYQVSLPWFHELHRFLYPYLDYDEAVELHETCHEFTICGLHGGSSSENANDSDSDRLEAFSMTMTRYLKKMDKVCALRAQTEIQQMLKDMLNRSKVV
ncbi:uncharacterized protein LOC143429663 [Xylocopa sonorina]|uniref:uncharacterized protein LOC143429663 n=1 Tax=Xylocopa sonorina TaxID=1818115 RepID=UPI00403AF037